VTNYPREGARISYVGNGNDGRVLGERGRLLARDHRSGHVKWADNSITMVDLEDIAAVASTYGAARAQPRDELDDSLAVGPIQAVGLRQVLDTEGQAGVLNALAAAGQLGGLVGIAEESLSFTAQRIRQEPAFREAVAQLDDDEVDALIQLAAQVLLRDALREGPDAD
jgi:hypothetical protein